MRLSKDAPTRNDVSIIRALCARMWSQLSVIRSDSRLASNEPIDPNVGPLSVREIVKIVQSAVQDAPTLNSNGSHRFEISLEAPSWLEIEVDLPLLEMIVWEVIDNTVKYAVPGGLIFVRLNQQNADGLVLSVVSTSPLVPPEDLKLLFERGYRGRLAMLTTADGSGMGLFLVKKVMNALQGDVIIESRGSTFTTSLEFPIKRVRVTSA